MAIAPFVCPLLVGRDAERQELRELLTGATNRRGGIIFLSGDAGIGKTRLVQEVCHDAGNSGLLVMQGGCTEDAQAIPYQGIADALRRYLRGLSPEQATRAIIGLEVELTALLPEIHPDPSVPRSQDEGDRNRIYEGVLKFLFRAAGERPLVLLLEDIHWSDEATLWLVRYLARHISDASLIVLTTFRTDEPEQPLPLRAFVSDLTTRRMVRGTINLNPLTWSETREMIRAIAGVRPTTALVDELFARAEGNPLFSEEMLRWLLSRRAFPTLGAQDVAREFELVPRSLSETLRRRVSRLSGPARNAIAVAAVIGRRFERRLLASVLGADDAAISECLHEALDYQLIVEVGDDRGFEFRHALIQEAAAQTMLSYERRQLHHQIAEAVQAMDSQPVRMAAVLAHHYLRAGARAEARRFAEQAGDEAWSHGAPRDAARWYSQALSVSRDVDETTLIPLLEKAARASAEAGRFTEASDTVDRVVGMYHTMGNQVAEGEGLSWRAAILWHAGDPEAAEALLNEAALILKPLGHTLALARCYARLADLYTTLRRGRQAYALARQALEVATTLDAREIVAVAHRVIGSILAAGTDPERGRSLLLLAITEAMEGKDAFEASVSRGRLVSAYIKVSDWTAAEETTRGDIASCMASGLRSREARAKLRLAEIFRLTGKWREAEEACQEAERLIEETAFDWILASLERASLLADQGRWAELRVSLHDILPFAEQSSEWQTLGRALFLLGRASEGEGDNKFATIHVHRALSLWRETDDLFDGLPLLSFACRLFCTTGSLIDARTCLGDVNRIKERSPIATVSAYAAQINALVAAAKERWDDAAKSWMESCSHWSQIGRPWDHAQALVGLAEVLVRGGSRAGRNAAREYLLTAREIFKQLGAPDAASVDDLLRRSRLVAPPSRRAGETLSARECDVVKCVAAGLTNRQIGEELFLSPKTVENHVGRVLAKLRLTSRTQLAAYVVEHGLTSDIADFRADPISG